jgi:hypothetical protein
LPLFGQPIPNAVLNIPRINQHLKRDSARFARDFEPRSCICLAPWRPTFQFRRRASVAVAAAPPLPNLIPQSPSSSSSLKLNAHVCCGTTIKQNGLLGGAFQSLAEGLELPAKLQLVLFDMLLPHVQPAFPAVTLSVA